MQEVVGRLRDIFLALQFGPRTSVDPVAFTKCLNLDTGVQQARAWAGPLRPRPARALARAPLQLYTRLFHLAASSPLVS